MEHNDYNITELPLTNHLSSFWKALIKAQSIPASTPRTKSAKLKEENNTGLLKRKEFQNYQAIPGRVFNLALLKFILITYQNVRSCLECSPLKQVNKYMGMVVWFRFIELWEIFICLAFVCKLLNLLLFFYLYCWHILIMDMFIDFIMLIYSYNKFKPTNCLTK